MATLNSYLSQSPQGGITNVNLSDDLNTYGVVNTRPPVVVPVALMGYRVATPAFSAPGNVKASVLTSSYYGDFYNRVHIRPSSLDLGNLLGSTYEKYTVWNAFNVTKDLLSVSYTGLDGISITSSRNPVGVFQPNEEASFFIEATLEGPSSINATVVYTFDATANNVSLSITGQRVVVWSFMPETQVKERYEFATDVLKSFNTEQRVSLRLSPRQSLEYNYMSSPRQLSRMRAIAKEWTHRRYGVPVWYEASKVDTLTANSTVLSVSTSSADFRVGGLAIVWQDDLNYEAVEITDITSSSLTVKRPLTASYSGALVAPMRLGYATDGVRFSRTASDLTKSTVKFEVVDNVKLSLSWTPTTYKGYYAITDYTVIVGQTDEQTTRDLDVLDNSSGAITVDTTSNLPVMRSFISGTARDKPGRWKVKTWFHYLNGRQKAFWAPTWNKDLEITQPILSSSQNMVVKFVGFYTYTKSADILIRLKNGTRYLARVSSGGPGSGGTENLILESSLPVNILVADVDTICYMHLVRLDSDSIEFNYERGYLEVSSTTVGVSQ